MRSSLATAYAWSACSRSRFPGWASMATMSTVRAEPRTLRSMAVDDSSSRSVDLVRLVAHDLGRPFHRAGAHGAPGRHDRVQREAEARVERHRLGVARALDRPRAVRVAVGEGEPEQLAADAAPLAARHRAQLREHPVVLPHEGLRHPDDGPAVLGHPRPVRVGPEEVAGAVLAPPLVLDGVAGDREAVAGQHGRAAALEGRDRGRARRPPSSGGTSPSSDAQAEGRKAGRRRSNAVMSSS